MAWSQAQGCINEQASSCIRMQTVNQSGFVRDVEELSDATGTITARTPSLVLKGDHGLVSWHDNNVTQLKIKWVQLDAQNAPTGDIESESLNDLRADLLPTLAPTPSGFLLAFANNVNDTLQIHTLALDEQGQPLGPLQPITNGGEDKTNPALAVLDDSMALVWVEGGDIIDFQSLSAQGVPEGEIQRLVDNHNAGFRPNAFGILPGVGTAIFSAFENNNINDDRLHFNILNAQGDKLCIGQE